jgi:phosphonoacetaldehyde hydrolase
MQIKAIIFDWAGTTIDYGCFSPLSPFISAFAKYNLNLTPAQARAPMGKLKIDHVRELMNLATTQEQFYHHYQRSTTEEDIIKIYQEFERQVFAKLADFVIPLPYVVATVNQLRAMGLKIGSTTGYTKAMMEIILPLAKRQGYAPDYCVASSEVPRGRPYPYMIYQNMIALDIATSRSIIKVGDTISDILEGVNANVISVGVIQGSSEVGLSLAEFQQLDLTQRQSISKQVRYKMYAAGANYVLDNISELPNLVNAINQNFTRKQQAN